MNDWLLYNYERTVLIERIKDNLNQINQRYFEGTHGIITVTDNSDYVTVKKQGLSVADYDIQKLLDALESFSQEDREFLFPCDLWDYLDHCKYTLPENELKTDNELSVSEKRQVTLVDWLLNEPDLEYKEYNKAENSEWENFQLTQEIEEMTARIHELKQDKESNEAWIENLNQRVHDLESTIYLLQRETNQITVLNESVTQLHTRIYQLEQENKQLKSQLEAKPEPKLDKKLTANDIKIS